MKLLFKFNLVFILVFALGLAATGYVSWRLLERNARDEIAQNARLLMDAGLSTRAYTSSQVNPLLQTQMKYTFQPQSIPAYAVAEVFSDLRKKYSEYFYKEAALNPTNPRNRAVDWEADIVGRFRASADQKELVGERDTPLGRTLYIARPLRITNPACLVCHDTIERAPKTLIDKYGQANGFGWKLNEVVGAQVVSVPMSVPLARAEKTFHVFMVSLVGIFVAIGVVLNLMLWAMVIRPVTKLSKLADRISLGEVGAPEFKAGGRDEIGRLAESITRMRRSLEQAMNMLGA